MDVGSAPDKKFSNNYQSGPLSFEMVYSGKKIITNSGYFQNYKHQLNKISKSTAAHSTLNIDNTFRRISVHHLEWHEQILY